jgi:hypothetical protein
MRLSPKEASRFDIPLCRMIYMPLVRPTLVHDIKRLEAEFTHGYRPGASVFYVSTTNENGEERLLKDVDTSNWGPHRTSVNDEFEAKLALNPHRKSYVVVCSSFVMGTIGSRHGLDTLTGFIVMTQSGITPWAASVWIARARWPSY